jgi:peptidoglycan-N-acetylglucosamine deacetylase
MSSAAVVSSLTQHLSMKYQFFSVVLLVTLYFVISPASAQTVTGRDPSVAEVCRLLEEQRYDDSITLAESLKQEYSDDSSILDAHGTVALLIGDIPVARYDFKSAEHLSDDPFAQYGLALCDMLNDDSGAALKVLAAIDISSIPCANASSEITFAKAVCLAKMGNTTNALTLAAEVSNESSAELVALIKPAITSSRIVFLQSFIAQGMDDGVPRVVEEPGLRLVFANDIAPIEPSIIDQNTQASLASHFTSSNASPFAKTMSGLVTIAPPRPVEPGTSIMNVSVDGQVIGATNAAPYQIPWDSHGSANGEHTITFSESNSDGVQVGIEVEDVFVLNSKQEDNSTEKVLPAATEARLWTLLQICPAYKVVEFDLAMAYFSLHDQEGYETHILRAAALDPDYRDVRVRIHPLFLGQVPSTFPVPDGTTLPSSLGLSAGSASKAGFWAGSPYVREMALTFDDGPIPGPSRQLVEALKAANAHGTFFVVGMQAAQSPDSLRLMAANGNAVEDHTYTHPNLTQLLPEHVLQEILRTAVIIQATTGLWPHFLRPPGGNTNPFVLETARACGMSGAFWTIDALPAEESGSPDGVVKWVLSRARPGAIVLMHNGMAATIAAIPQMVSGLRRERYRLVTIRQLAADALAGRR